MSSIEELMFLDFFEEQLGELLDKNLFAYEGYHPKITFDKMKDKEKDERRLISDIQQICYFYVVRGKKVTKATQRMSDGGSSAIKKLQKKYNILDVVPTRKEDINIPRIVGITPLYCAQLLKAGHGRIVGDKQDLPKSLCFPQAPSIIPRSKPDLYNLWLNWAKDFNKIINQGKKESDVDFYGKIVWNSDLYNDEQRSECLKTLDIKM